jgi:hypothetical protein
MSANSESLWQKFHVGQRVWCKDGKFLDPQWRLVPLKPKENEIYTIRALELQPFGPSREQLPALLLEELVNPPRKWRSYLHEKGFALWRFEPVREQNIEIFRQMCREVESKEPAKCQL